MTEQPEDPVVDEVREARHRVSQTCGHDPARLVEHYMKLQERYKERLLAGEPSAERPGHDAA